MSKFEDFIIVNNELQKYVGTDTNVVIPNGVIAIAQNAFMGAKIESVVIPDTVTRIDSQAFYDCNNLLKVDMPDSVNYIGVEAFMSCVNLKYISIPKNLTNIEKGVFNYCRELNVEIPEGVLNIGAQAFSHTGTVNVTLPTTLINVGIYAFAYSKVESVKVLGNTAFERYVFKGCKNFREFIVLDGNQTYKTIDGDLYSKDGKILVCMAKTKNFLEIPYGVEIIGKWACACSGISKIFFPKTVNLIDEYAFYNCCNIKKLSIPGNIKTIKECAFSGEWGHTSLTELEIGEGVEVIEKDAIRGNFKSVVLPNSIKFIGNCAFISGIKETFCVDITRVSVSANIDKLAFGNCNRGWFSRVYSRTDLPYENHSGGINYVDVDECGYDITSFPLSMLANRNHKKYVILTFVEHIKRGQKIRPHVKKEKKDYIDKNYKEWLSEAVDNSLLMDYFVSKKLLTKEDVEELLKLNIKNEEVRQLLIDCVKTRKKR